MFDLNCARMPARAGLSIRLEVSCQDVAGEKNQRRTRIAERRKLARCD
jgi:hypothetical protein